MDESQTISPSARPTDPTVGSGSRVFEGIPYEKSFPQSPRWWMDEAGDFFAGHGPVHRAMDKITKRLDALGVPYAVVGGMALNYHGFQRVTVDIDILVTRDGLARIHSELEGLGYLPPFPASRHLRDCDLGVKIEFLVAGEFPGDGKPKPVSFPEPGRVSVEAEGIRYVNLPTLVEMKIASGQFHATRLKDLADVMELIKIIKIPRSFADHLHPYVRDKFLELWDAAHIDFPEAPDRDRPAS